MQTFLPYPEFDSVRLLDRRRLGKQIVECHQLLLGQYSNHPASIMWSGYRWALLKYGSECYKIWGNSHKSGEYILSELDKLEPSEYPEWIQDGRVSYSHRCNLARKGVLEHKSSNVYCWPIHENGKWIYRHKMVEGPWLPGEYND
jgi:hypothetical protein